MNNLELMRKRLEW
jgi:hypothetical protein